MLVWGNCVWDAPSIGEQSTGAASTGRQPVRVKSVGAAGGEFTLLRTHEKLRNLGRYLGEICNKKDPQKLLDLWKIETDLLKILSRQ